MDGKLEFWDLNENESSHISVEGRFEWQRMICFPDPTLRSVCACIGMLRWLMGHLLSDESIKPISEVSQRLCHYFTVCLSFHASMKGV